MPIRGNANARLGTVHAGELDGVVLARVGLARIGHLHAVTQVFEPEATVIAMPSPPTWRRPPQAAHR